MGGDAASGFFHLLWLCVQTVFVVLLDPTATTSSITITSTTTSLCSLSMVLPCCCLFGFGFVSGLSKETSSSSKRGEIRHLAMLLGRRPAPAGLHRALAAEVCGSHEGPSDSWCCWQQRQFELAEFCRVPSWIESYRAVETQSSITSCRLSATELNSTMYRSVCSTKLWSNETSRTNERTNEPHIELTYAPSLSLGFGALLR